MKTQNEVTPQGQKDGIGIRVATFILTSIIMYCLLALFFYCTDGTSFFSLSTLINLAIVMGISYGVVDPIKNYLKRRKQNATK